MNNNKNKEKMIKEIKTIYSGRTRPNKNLVSTPEIKTLNKGKSKKNLTFFNSLVDKLNLPQ